LEASVADTSNGVVVGVGRAGGDGDTLSSDVLGTGDANTGLEVGIINFVLIAVRLEVRNNTVSVNVRRVTEVAFTSNTVVALVGSTGLALSIDKEESWVAITLTVFLISILSTVLIGGAGSIDY
jgi:hypothetical protein